MLLLPVFLVNKAFHISILHRYRDINTYLPKQLRRRVTLTTPTWGQFVITRQTLLESTRAQNFTILFSAIPEKFKGCKIMNWIT